MTATPPPAVPAETKAPKAPRRGRASKRVPLLLEAVYAASVLIVILTGALTAGLSWLSGVSALWVLARAGLAVLLVGLVLWLLNYQLMHGALAAALAAAREQVPEAPVAEPPPDFIHEWKA